MTPTAILQGRHTFHKLEKLCSRKLFTELAAKGQKINAFPFRLVWLQSPLPSQYPIQAGFTVPKRNFKKAVDRNRVKRLMREVYRKNKADLYSLKSVSGSQYALLFIYSGTELPDFPITEEKIKLLLHRFAELSKKNTE